MQSILFHTRFYAALLAGLAVFFIARRFGAAAPLLAGGDAFFLLFLTLMGWLVTRQDEKDLRRRAKSDDEGIVIVVLVTLAALSFFSEAVFVALNQKQGLEKSTLLLAVTGALLGWLALHTIMAFHYANLHYFDDPKTSRDDIPDLKFPHCDRPGPWDFLYFSFVIGMTAQVSDVQVQTSPMRRAVLLHGVVSFFINTVFIAMAVNAAVAMAG